VVPIVATQTPPITDQVALAAADVHRRLAALPAGLVASNAGASNNWAVSGAKSSSGKALMAGDPHLHLTLPAIWFQLSMDSPGYHTSGVGIPGTPGVLIGHNEHISWSLTAAENQQTFYYIEHEEATHPGEYLWNGLWRKYKAVTYDIPVQGGPTEHLTVKLSVHGPVITERGQTTSVWWAGNIPSQDLDVLMGINQAADYQAFRNALKGWYSPTHNFVYADDTGNIGLISAGYYPQVAAGQPWLPMAGTGENDVIGTIPFDYIPQVYNPPSGFIWSANQRQVTSDYPYYIGTALNFATGYRSNEIFRVLSKGVNQGGKLSAADMMALQTDTRDFLAAEITPILLQALAGSQALRDQQAAQLLATWDYRMETDSAAATIWWTFWQEYIAQSFEPWWKAKKVSVDRAELNDALGQYLEALALAGKTVCTPPNCTSPAASACPTSACERLSLTLALRSAFGATTAKLTRQLGADPKKWTWGKVHQRVVENLAVRSLTYGPRPDRGDANTPLAAPDFPSSHGPSWRMVVDWGAGTFQGAYPGGQSENPASQWYADRIDAWWNGKYTAMLTAEQAASSKGSKVWRLRP
jgi:penicillin amidase